MGSNRANERLIYDIPYREGVLGSFSIGPSCKQEIKLGKTVDILYTRNF